jgi:hypothetical protein
LKGNWANYLFGNEWWKGKKKERRERRGREAEKEIEKGREIIARNERDGYGWTKKNRK